MNVRYSGAWLSASLCASLLTDLLGYSSIFETNLLVYANKYFYICSSQEIKKKKKNPALISDIKPDSRGKFHLSEKILWLWTPGFCSFPAGSLQYVRPKERVCFRPNDWSFCFMWRAGGEVQGNHSSWHACFWHARRGISSSAMFSNASCNLC